MTFRISYLLTKACTIENQTLIMKKEELFYYLALQSVDGIGPVNARKLIQHCGSVEGIFKESCKNLELIKGIGVKLKNRINHKETFLSASRELQYLEKHQIEAVTIADKSYPSGLKNCYDAPLLVFRKGNFDFKQKKVISIVGTRKMTVYGRRFLAEFIESIKTYRPIIVSGLAYGIDACAHQESIRNKICTVGVLAHGFDRIYPRAHHCLAEKMMENGGLLTEFWSGSAPEKANFVKRNRIIAGVSEATIVVESADRGGSLITAELAASYDRDVFALPGRTNDAQSRGCNMLIKSNKAAMIETVKDLEYVLGWSPAEAEKKAVQKELFIDLDPKEKLVCEHLKNKEMILLDQLSVNIGLSVSSTLTLLLQLELKGLVKSLPGKKYQLI